ncbi:MAG: ASCH domain-containing protein [Hyphomicrobiaceae bacterium]|nr:ASCH domain-containing protein [Hyphomicrobiaceae bacterium]
MAALVLAGRKRATVWDGRRENPTASGMRWVVTANERPVAVIETVLVEQRTFDSIDAAFAFEEGEGDRTLAFWRAVHESYFRSEGHFAPEMVLWTEHFRLIEVLDPALAAAAEAHVAAEQAEGEALTRE